MKIENPSEHLKSFQRLWTGGFYAGDPMDPTDSPHGLFGYLSVPYAITLACIPLTSTAPPSRSN